MSEYENRWHAIQVDSVSKQLLVNLLEQEEKRLTVAARESSWDIQDRAITELVHVKLTLRAIHGK